MADETASHPQVHLPGAKGVQIGDHNHQVNVDLGGRRRRVLVGSTPELAQHPLSKSFVAAARNAVARAGLEFAQMREWNRNAQLSASEYRARMRNYDIYVNLLGFRYGPVVRDDPGRSCARLEFETAVIWDRPHYAFLINVGEFSAPHAFFVDADPDNRQELFRAAVRASGVEQFAVDEPDQLEQVLFDVLVCPPVQHRHRDLPRDGRQTKATPLPAPPDGLESTAVGRRLPALDGIAVAMAGGLGLAGFIVLWLLVGMGIGWAAVIALAAAVGTYVGGLDRTPRGNPKAAQREPMT